MKKALALVLCVMVVFGAMGGSSQTAYAADVDAPRGVSVETNKSGNPVITWNEVDGAKQYRVFRKLKTINHGLKWLQRQNLRSRTQSGKRMRGLPYSRLSSLR